MSTLITYITAAIAALQESNEGITPGVQISSTGKRITIEIDFTTPEDTINSEKTNAEIAAAQAKAVIASMPFPPNPMSMMMGGMGGFGGGFGNGFGGNPFTNPNPSYPSYGEFLKSIEASDAARKAAEKARQEYDAEQARKAKAADETIAPEDEASAPMM